MSSAESTAPTIPAEATTSPSEVENSKRDVVNGGSGVEEPPSKKARVDELLETNGQSRPSREKGVAPIKAEYVCV